MNLYIDFETSGLPVKNSNPFTQIENYNSCKILSVGILYKKQEYYKTISTNEKEWNEESFNIHGITKDELKKGIPITELFIYLKSIVTDKTIIIGYNIDFDIDVLCAELINNNESEFAKYVYELRRLCVMKCYTRYFNLYYNVKLTECYKKIYKKEFNAHNALEDIKATKLVLEWLIKNEISS